MTASVLHCYEDYKWTGPSGPVARLCAALSERGWRAHLACRRCPPSDRPRLGQRARELGVTAYDCFYFESEPNLRMNGRDIIGLRDLILAGGYDIVHAHGSWDHVLAALAVRRLPWRPPLVRTDHGAREFSWNPAHRLQFGPAMTDHLVVLGDRLRAKAVESLGRDPATVTTVRGAVDVEKFHPRRPPPGRRQKFGLGPDDVVFGIVARVQWHRRFDVLLDAFDRVRRRDGRVKLVVLGRGTHKEEILDRPVVRMGLEETVYPLGYRRDDYRDVLAMLDAGMMLVPGSDGSCRAAMEMAAMAKPLVVAERGVLPDIVADGRTGTAVKDTPENVAAAVLETAHSPQKRRRWGQAARERMVRLFGLERQAERMGQVYRRVLAGRGGD